MLEESTLIILCCDLVRSILLSKKKERLQAQVPIISSF